MGLGFSKTDNKNDAAYEFNNGVSELAVLTKLQGLTQENKFNDNYTYDIVGMDNDEMTAHMVQAGGSKEKKEKMTPELYRAAYLLGYLKQGGNKNTDEDSLGSMGTGRHNFYDPKFLQDVIQNGGNIGFLNEQSELDATEHSLSDFNDFDAIKEELTQKIQNSKLSETSLSGGSITGTISSTSDGYTKFNQAQEPVTVPIADGQAGGKIFNDMSDDLSTTSVGLQKYTKKEFSATSHTNQLGGARTESGSSMLNDDDDDILDEIFDDNVDDVNFDDKESKQIKEMLEEAEENRPNDAAPSSYSQEIVSSLSGGSSEFSGTSNLEVSESYNPDEVEYVKYNSSESESQYEFREPHSQKRFD